MWILLTKTLLSEGQMFHFQMTLFNQRVIIRYMISFYSIYVTYLYRSKDLIAIWLLAQEIQGPKICELSILA